MRILWTGPANPGATGLHVVEAMRRLGHHVDVLPSHRLLGPGYVRNQVRRRTGYRLTRTAVNHRLREELAGRTYDLCWVGTGRELDRSAVRLLRRHCGAVVVYQNDDPWGGRDGRLWDTFRAALPEYDLVCVLRDENLAEARADGARSVLRVWFSYDEVHHAGLADTRRRAGAAPLHDVVFVGTWEPDRGPILQGLLEAGLDVAFWGPRWNKAPEFPAISRAWRGGFVADGAYVDAMLTGRLGLGLLSRGNRDQHTQRSLEVPAMGIPLCAQRTPEHEQLFGEHANDLLWGSVSECVEVCRRIVGDDDRRAALGAALQTSVRGARVGNEDLVRTVLGGVAHPAPNPTPPTTGSLTLA